jgi:hypothetical protein
MGDFYDHLDTRGATGALRQAMLTTIVAGYPEPKHWAVFVLIGHASVLESFRMCAHSEAGGRFIGHAAPAPVPHQQSSFSSSSGSGTSSKRIFSR